MIRSRSRSRPAKLSSELPAGPQVEVVVDHAEGGRERAAEQQADQARRIDRRRGSAGTRSWPFATVNATATTMNAVATATPPRAGSGRR